MPFTISFFISALLLICLLAETWTKRGQVPWALPAALIYLTTIAWYFVDPFLHPDEYAFIPDFLFSLSYLQVIIFLVAFRLMLPKVARYVCANHRIVLKQYRSMDSETLFVWLLIIWGAMLILGFSMMDEDATLFDAFFPLDGRTEGSKLLWARSAAGDIGPLGFVISSGGYIYVLVSSLLGVTFVFMRSPGLRAFNILLLFLIWPYFLLCGTRSAFLAVILPGAIAYILLGRQWLSVRLTIAAVAFLFVNAALLVVGSYRSIGFHDYFANNGPDEVAPEEMGHNGLNMIQELCFVNVYYLSGACKLSYGQNYLVEALNVVPRAIWPGKPFLGIEYSLWRGFGGGTADIGVVATISTGFLGGGIVNFGPYFGPLAPAILLAVWTALLTRWWLQRDSLLRACLFLAGMGLTFNLGRDITLLVLWPVVFGYMLTRLAEWLNRIPVAPARPRMGNQPQPLAQLTPRAL